MSCDKRNLDGDVYTQGLKESAEKYVPQMRAEGAQIVVALSWRAGRLALFPFDGERQLLPLDRAGHRASGRNMPLRYRSWAPSCPANCIRRSNGHAFFSCRFLQKISSLSFSLMHGMVTREPRIKGATGTSS